MHIFYTSNEMNKFIKNEKLNHKKIGFAPTMGALHTGHLSLYEKAKTENDIVISSIFVNPTQFNNSDDLKKYPRTIEKDIELLQNSEFVDGVYIPSIKEIYPQTIASKSYNFGGIELEMEGSARPGHFDGVATVVETLFKHVEPDNAYFGEKDFQQLIIIKKLVQIKQIPVNIVAVPTIRDKNGLALSSRNQRLSENERESAKIIYKTLKNVKDWLNELNVAKIYSLVKEIFEKQEAMTLEYFKIADEETLKETKRIEPGRKYRAFIVVWVGDVRLIDNISL